MKLRSHQHCEYLMWGCCCCGHVSRAFYIAFLAIFYTYRLFVILTNKEPLSFSIICFFFLFLPKTIFNFRESTADGNRVNTHVLWFIFDSHKHWFTIRSFEMDSILKRANVITEKLKYHAIMVLYTLNSKIYFLKLWCVHQTFQLLFFFAPKWFAILCIEKREKK